MNSVLIYFPPLFFLLMGLTALTNPVNVTKYFGLTGLNEDMRSEVRAVSGGFGVAICIILLAATRIDAIREFFWLRLSLLVLGWRWECDGASGMVHTPMCFWEWRSFWPSFVVSLLWLGVNITLIDLYCTR